jgi:hypothetical protein
MTVERWLAAAEADAERRGMPELKPLLQGLAAATTALRAAEWNERADVDRPHAAEAVPPVPSGPEAPRP